MHWTQTQDRKFKTTKTGKKLRATLDCVQKLISITLNEVRKPFQKILKDKYDIEFTLKLSSEQINPVIKCLIHHPCHLFDWIASIW